MRSRLVYGATLLLALTPAAAAPAAAHDRCRPRVIDLGLLPGSTQSIAFGMNRAGVVVGWSNDAQRAPRPVRWVGGRPELLPSPADQPAIAFDIDRSGLIVGRTAAPTTAQEQALVWRDGRLSLLPGFPDSSGAAARRISDSGLITGSAVDTTGRSHAVLWFAGRLIDLGIPRGYDEAFGMDVTDNGVVAVNAFKGDEIAGFRWERGRFRPLGAGADAQVATARGEVGGSIWGASQTATVWDRWGTPRSLGLFAGGDFSAILATDGAGAYAGGGNFEPDGPPHALLRRGRGPLLTLPGLDGPDGPAVLRHLDREGNAAGISGAGHATVWTCVWRQAFVPRAAPQGDAARDLAYGDVVDSVNVSVRE